VAHLLLFWLIRKQINDPAIISVADGLFVKQLYDLPLSEHYKINKNSASCEDENFVPILEGPDQVHVELTAMRNLTDS
jgi:hypothetical protein